MDIAAGPRPAALGLTLGIGVVLAMAPASQAKAFVLMPTNGPAACRATSGAGQGAFYSNIFYIWNGSASNQYLTCSMPTWNLDYAVPTGSIYMYWFSGATGGTVTCTAQSGFQISSTPFIAQGNTQVPTLAPNTNDNIIFPSLPRPSSFHSINMICNVPPGFKLGLITPYDPDPPSGFGWVP